MLDHAGAGRERDAGAPARPAASGGEGRGARVVRLGLGGLWLVDGLLQAQPSMFGPSLIATVLAPAAAGQPAWLATFVHWADHVVLAHVLPFNAAFVAIQLAIGLALLSGRPRAVRIGAITSLIWALIVWFAGEGMGGILTGTASVLAGAPGSALLYAVASVLVLAPQHADAEAYGVTLPALAAALVLALGIALQANPLFFGALGLSGVFATGAMMPQPSWLRAPLVGAANLAAAHPVTVNLAVAALFAVAALATLVAGRRPHHVLAPWALWFALAWTAATWWFGQDLGMPFGGMATDPNTAAPLALLLVAGALGGRSTAATSRQPAMRRPSRPADDLRPPLDLHSARARRAALSRRDRP